MYVGLTFGKETKKLTEVSNNGKVYCKPGVNFKFFFDTFEANLDLISFPLEIIK